MDVWFDLKLGDIETDDFGSETKTVVATESARVTVFPPVGLSDIRPELHALLDVAIDKMLTAGEIAKCDHGIEWDMCDICKPAPSSFAALTRMNSTYPNYPGATAAGTSQDAADTMAEYAPTLRHQVLRLVKSSGGITTDEAAERLHVSALSVRPRFSELRKMGKIEETGECRMNTSGRMANVWRIRPEHYELPTMQ